jgi:hypothetical protein
MVNRHTQHSHLATVTAVTEFVQVVSVVTLPVVQSRPPSSDQPTRHTPEWSPSDSNQGDRIHRLG